MLHQIASMATNEADDDRVAMRQLNASTQRLGRRKKSKKKKGKGAGGSDSEDSEDSGLGSPFRLAATRGGHSGKHAAHAPKLAAEWITAAEDAEMTEEGNGLVAFANSLPMGGMPGSRAAVGRDDADEEEDEDEDEEADSSADSLGFMIGHSPDEKGSDSEGGSSDSDAGGGKDPRAQAAGSRAKEASEWDTSDDDDVLKAAGQLESDASTEPDEEEDGGQDEDDEATLGSYLTGSRSRSRRSAAAGRAPPDDTLPPTALCRFLTGPKPKPPKEKGKKNGKSRVLDDMLSFSSGHEDNDEDEDDDEDED